MSKLGFQYALRIRPGRTTHRRSPPPIKRILLSAYVHNVSLRSDAQTLVNKNSTVSEWKDDAEDDKQRFKREQTTVKKLFAGSVRDLQLAKMYAL